MCARAAEDGQQAIAITDHGNLFGATDVQQESQAKHGVKSDRRHRGLRRPPARERRTSARTMVEGDRTQELLPSGAAGGELYRLQEPDQAWPPPVTSRVSTTGRESTRSCCGECTPRAWSACRRVWPARSRLLPPRGISTSRARERRRQSSATCSVEGSILARDARPRNLRAARGSESRASSEARSKELGIPARRHERHPLPAARGPHRARLPDLHPAPAPPVPEPLGHDLHAREHYLKTQEEMRRLFALVPRGPSRTPWPSPSAAASPSRNSRFILPEFPGPGRLRPRRLLREGGPKDGLEQRLARAEARSNRPVTLQAPGRNLPRAAWTSRSRSSARWVFRATS